MRNYHFVADSGSWEDALSRPAFSATTAFAISDSILQQLPDVFMQIVESLPCKAAATAEPLRFELVVVRPAKTIGPSWRVMEPSEK